MATIPRISTGIAACAGSLFLYKLVQMVMMGRRIKAHGYVLFSSDLVIWRMLIPSWTNIPWVIHGNLQPLQVKHTEFDQVGMEALIRVSLERPSRPVILLADIEAIKEITRPKSHFLQDVRSSGAIFGMYGANILMLEGEEWKRHRRITQRAFSDENTRLIWSESILVMEGLFEKWDKRGEQDVYVSKLNAITEAVALMVISSGVLGQRMSWDEGQDTTLPPGYDLSFQQTVDTVARKIVTRMITPSWAEGWSESTRRMATGYREFGQYLRAMAASYRQLGTLDQDLTGTKTITGAPTDNLFKILMDGNEEDKEEGIQPFTVEESTGNAFVFMFAGHETTAHALSFAMGLLAAYPDIQEGIYALIKKTIGSRERLEYHDQVELKLVTGVFLEALRLYPPVTRLISKMSSEDTILTVARNGPNDDENSRETVVVPAGSEAIICVTAIHYNGKCFSQARILIANDRYVLLRGVAKYWPEPDEFRPSRFVGAYNRDAFVPFGTGRRACIGRKFAETEATAVLAAVLGRYEILIDHSKFPSIPGETLAARRERLLRPHCVLTLAPENLPLIFRRR